MIPSCLCPYSELALPLIKTITELLSVRMRSDAPLCGMPKAIVCSYSGIIFLRKVHFRGIIIPLSINLE